MGHLGFRRTKRNPSNNRISIQILDNILFPKNHYLGTKEIPTLPHSLKNPNNPLLYHHIKRKRLFIFENPELFVNPHSNLTFFHLKPSLTFPPQNEKSLTPIKNHKKNFAT